MTPERLVFDCNVLISAALVAGGTPARALGEAVARNTLVLSDPTYDELVSRLMRSKFDRYADRADREVFCESIADLAHWVEIAGRSLGCRDPDDDKYLETALVGGAEAIVTGDHDLLAMHPLDRIAILSPGDWLRR